MARKTVVLAALSLVTILVVLKITGLLDESCFERLERVHLYGESYDGELNEAESAC